METRMKKGIFFSVDAIIAAAIIALSILIAYPLSSEIKPKTEINADILEAFSALKAGEINEPYVQALLADRSISDGNISVLEALGELYVTNLTKAQIMASAVLQELDVKDNIGIWYGNSMLTSKNATSYESAQRVETARQIISGIREGESVTGFSAKAFMRSKKQTKYTYIGGYVGEGNITIPVSYNGTPSGARMEAATSSGFEMYANNNFIAQYLPSPSVIEPANYTIPISALVNGTNFIELRKNNLSLAGGFVRVTYESALEYEQPVRYYFPGIQGVINLYDGFFIPGTLQSLSAHLHYSSPYATFLTIGNITVFNQSSANETTIDISNAQLNALLEYNALSNRSIPLRFGLENISLVGEGVTGFDVVLITDASGSMDWRLDNDATGTARACNDPLINSPSTKRISLAKCLDIQFVQTILNSSADSRVALVSFSNDANDYVNLTRNQALLNSTISNYAPLGATCVSCSINRAYQILQAESNASRAKFIVTMSDGVANRRSVASCSDIYGTGAVNIEKPQAGGAAGLMIKRNETSALWNTLPTGITEQINDLDFLNETLAFAVGNNGRIIKWNGTGWSAMSSPVTSALNSIDIYNATHALAAGSSGRVIRWNGAGWSLYATISNSPVLNSISMYSPSLVFAGGVRSNTGRIYKSTNNGASWAEDHASGNNFRGIKIISSNLAFAVGNAGRIMRWTGSSWSQMSSGTAEDLYSIDAYNTTRAFAVGGFNGKSIIVRYNGASWSSSLNKAGDSLRSVLVFSNKSYAMGEGAMLFNESGSAWQQKFDILPAYQGNSTNGISCTSDEDSCTEANSYPALNANYSACRVRRELNATIYSVGFGPVGTCAFAAQVLQSIASCGNGSYYASSNASELQEFYQNIAQSIIQISYSEQTAQTSGNISTRLFPDSYIEFNYTKNPVPYGLLLTYQKQFDNDTSISFEIPANTTVIDAKVLSYSGPRWTAQVRLNNNLVYDLNAYGQDYSKKGDPFEIHLPVEMIQAQNNITLVTGLSQANITGGSPFNKLVYTLLKNASGYSPIVSLSRGCVWTIDFESEANITIAIPKDYNSTEQCTYQFSSTSHNNNDAAQEAVYRLLQSLDLDKNNKVDIEFTADDIDITLTEVTGIPFPWSTEVQVRVWR